MTCGCSEETHTLAQPHAHDGHTHPHPHPHEHSHTDAPGHGHAHEHEHEHEYGHDHEHGPFHEPGAQLRAQTLRAPSPGTPVLGTLDLWERSPDRDDPADARVPRRIQLEQDVLSKNNALAAQVRARLRAQDILALNLLSSPGAGKTTLLEWTVRALCDQRPLRVIEGDQETALDADRIRAAGCEAIQVNTGTGCHLDAGMVLDGLSTLSPPRGSLLLIENVGNLVCPALFDLGEQAKVVVVSVTEGDDKPLKYPHMFRASDLLLINKVDLLPHVPFSVERCVENAWRVNPKLQVLLISALRGDGLDDWLGWIRDMSRPAPSLESQHSAH